MDFTHHRLRSDGGTIPHPQLRKIEFKTDENIADKEKEGEERKNQENGAPKDHEIWQLFYGHFKQGLLDVGGKAIWIGHSFKKLPTYEATFTDPNTKLTQQQFDMARHGMVIDIDKFWEGYVQNDFLGEIRGYLYTNVFQAPDQDNRLGSNISYANGYRVARYETMNLEGLPFQVVGWDTNAFIPLDVNNTRKRRAASLSPERRKKNT